MSTHEYDAGLLRLSLDAGDAAWDPDASLLRTAAKPNPIHTSVSGHAHNYVQSMAYALALLEDGRVERAEAVVAACLAGQDTDPDSPTFGVWGYFAEEPVAKMVPPDPNQADFHGRMLALALFRHADALSPALAGRMREALHRAAVAIVKRDVSMDYTNIAAKGTFVLLAAAKILGDGESSSPLGHPAPTPAELTRLGRQRLHRFAAAIDRTGSFPEFSSPAYWLVAAEAVTALSEYAADGDEDLVAAILRRLWTHLARHWHTPTTQLGGPMSRSYTTSLARSPGLIAFLCKGTGHAEPFASYEFTTGDVHLVFPAILRPRCPPELFGELTRIPPAATHREFYALTGGAVAKEQRGGAAIGETVGTNFRDPVLTLGSVNQSDTWLQRRPLLGFWRLPSDGPWRRPARSVRLRFLRDGGDFASGSFSSVQDGGSVLWSLGLASPGGDRHLHLDTLDGPFEASSLTVRLELTGVESADVTVNGSPAGPGAAFGPGDVLAVRDGGVGLTWNYAAGRFGEDVPKGRVDATGDALVFDVDLLRAEQPVRVEPSGPVFVAGGLTLTSEPSWPDVSVASLDGETLLQKWTGPGLTLRSRATAGTREQHAAAYAATLAGGPVPAPRLDETRLS